MYHSLFYIPVHVPLSPRLLVRKFFLHSRVLSKWRCSSSSEVWKQYSAKWWSYV